MTMDTATDRPGSITILEERHMMSILLYLLDNGTCKKTDIYDGVSRNPRLARKLDVLEESGLIRQVAVGIGNRTDVMLTEKGNRVASAIEEMSAILRER